MARAYMPMYVHQRHAVLVLVPNIPWKGRWTGDSDQLESNIRVNSKRGDLQADAVWSLGRKSHLGEAQDESLSGSEFGCAW